MSQAKSVPLFKSSNAQMCQARNAPLSMNNSVVVCQAKNAPPPTAQSAQVEAQVEVMDQVVEYLLLEEDPVEAIAQVEDQEDGAQVEATVEVVVMEEGNGKDGLLILHAEVEDVVVDLLEVMEEEVVEAMVEVAVEVMEAVGEVVEWDAEEFHS